MRMTKGGLEGRNNENKKIKVALQCFINDKSIFYSAQSQ
jgi:hypothetical protein